MEGRKTTIAFALGLAAMLATTTTAIAQVQDDPSTRSSNVLVSLMYVTNAPNDRSYTPFYVFSIVNHDRKAVRLRGMSCEVPESSLLHAPVVNRNLPRAVVRLLDPGQSVIQAVGTPTGYEVWRLRVDFSPDGTADFKDGLTDTLAARSSWVPWVSVYPNPGDRTKKGASPTAAYDAVEAACRKAASESKYVFLKSGFAECAPCVHFDHYHNLPEVRKIIDKYYVIVAIDTESMPDGNVVFGKYARPSAPSWVIISPGKSIIVDSYSSPEGNVGFPGEPNEIACYLAALKKATPAITKDELSMLAEQLKKARGK